MRDQLLVAERAVLYAISFQLRIKVPYNDLLTLQQFIPEQHRHDIVNIAWNLVNDRCGLAGVLHAGVFEGTSVAACTVHEHRDQNQRSCCAQHCAGYVCRMAQVKLAGL
jgi:hypothetical protein